MKNATTLNTDDRDWPIEFRYVKRSIPVPHEVLQVRYRDDNTGVYYTAKDNRYTRWKDVPVVEE